MNRSTRAFLVTFPRRAVVYEAHIWQSLYRWTFRRAVTLEPGAQAFAYSSLLTPILIAFIAVSALEIPVVHFFLPWGSLRSAFLLLGIWGVTWMIGLLASLHIYPHFVSAAALRARYSFELDVELPWSAIESVTLRRRSYASGRKVQLERQNETTALNVPISSTTNVEFLLNEPATVRLPNGALEHVTALRIYADQPKALVSRAREHLRERALA